MLRPPAPPVPPRRNFATLSIVDSSVSDGERKAGRIGVVRTHAIAVQRADHEAGPTTVDAPSQDPAPILSVSSQRGVRTTNRRGVGCEYLVTKTKSAQKRSPHPG
ncbi:hypothetical protein MBOT_08050 [Mycobacterium botniense]|uniref:Uncharacterized protein n=1 Tax=Mycobacterium botniense TaxID=84962 RepID=A0A7I9XV26_9MYCO|nr:hypothetical protein MBOT_08050 [Mycobacterium botniense]